MVAEPVKVAFTHAELQRLFAACKIARVDPEFVSMNGDDPLALVVSLNVKRRNLTASQRAIAAAEACSKLNIVGRKASAAFGVSTGYISQASALVERAPDAAREVKAGRPLAEAYEEFQRNERAVKMRESSLGEHALALYLANAVLNRSEGDNDG